MADRKTEILYEDNAILTVYKPAGLATQTASVAQPDVVSELTNYLRKNVKKAGAAESSGAYLGVIHRLDQPVEGLLVFAKNRKAAAVLSAQLQRAEAGVGFCKHYYAVLCGIPQPSQGKLEDWLCRKDSRAEILEYYPGKTGPQADKAAVSPKQDARRACLEYRILEVVDSEGIALADIQIETGRFHQIRAQMAHAGTPLLGDMKYGDERSGGVSRKLGIRHVALCAYRLDFTHPISGKRMHFQVKPKGEAFSFFSQL